MRWVKNCIRKACWLWECEEELEEGGGGGGGGGVRLEVVAKMVEGWKEMIAAFCMTSSIALATVSVQIEKKLANEFQFLSLALLLCFGSMGFGKMTKPIFPRVSQILYCVGGLLGVTAFFIATAIPYPPYFQIIVFLIYLIFCFIFMLIAIHNAPSPSPPL